MSQLLGKAQNPSEEHPMGVAVCGTPIEPGLIVWTNEYKPGIVTEHKHNDGWFDVRYATGGRTMQNPERVATVFEGKRAADEWPGGWHFSNQPEPHQKRVLIAVNVPDYTDPTTMLEELEERYEEAGGNVCIYESGESFMKLWKEANA